MGYARGCEQQENQYHDGSHACDFRYLDLEVLYLKLRNQSSEIWHAQHWRGASNVPREGESNELPDYTLQEGNHRSTHHLKPLGRHYSEYLAVYVRSR